MIGRYAAEGISPCLNKTGKENQKATDKRTDKIIPSR